MQAKIETLKARNSSDEEYLVYPRTLTKCVTNEDGENLDVIISNVVKDSDVTAIKGNVFIQEDAGETDNYVPINADLLGGHPASHFATIEDLENFSGGGASGSGTGTHQFFINGSNLETGWYKIGIYSDGVFECMINISDQGYIEDTDSGFNLQADVMYDGYNIRQLCCAMDENNYPKYIGFDYLERSGVDLYIHYTNPGYTDQSCTLTITNLASGETIYDGEPFVNGVLPYSTTFIKDTSGDWDWEPDAEEYNLILRDTRVEDKILVQTSVSAHNTTTGWYRIAENVRIPSGECTIDISDLFQGEDDYLGLSCSISYSALDCNKESDHKIKLLSCNISDGYHGFDKMRVVFDCDIYYAYIELHYTSAGDNDNSACVAIKNNNPKVWKSAMGNGEITVNQWLPVNFIPVDEELPFSMELITSYDLELSNISLATTKDLESVGSSHQYMLYYEGVLETGWYIIGRTMGMHSCNINIIDMGTMPGEEMPIFVQANVLSSEFVEALTSNVKILDVATYEGCAPYVGFDKIVTTRTEDGDIVVVMHYTNPGFEDHNCILTITSLMGGELTFDDYSVNFGMRPYDGNTLTYLCDEFAEDALVGQVREFELKKQPDLSDILARLEALEAKGVSDILDPEGVEF